jgi:ribosomal protein S21
VNQALRRGKKDAERVVSVRVRRQELSAIFTLSTGVDQLGDDGLNQALRETKRQVRQGEMSDRYYPQTNSPNCRV